MDKQNTFENVQDLVPTFSDFAECTEYFYNELGKLEYVSELTTRDKKKLKKVIMALFSKHLGLIKMKETVQQKKEIAEVNKTLSDLNSITKNMSRKNKSLKEGKSIVTLPLADDEAQKLLPNGNEIEGEK